MRARCRARPWPTAAKARRVACAVMSEPCSSLVAAAAPVPVRICGILSTVRHAGQQSHDRQRRRAMSHSASAAAKVQDSPPWAELPSEVLDAVAERSSTSSTAALRLTCRSWRRARFASARASQADASAAPKRAAAPAEPPAPAPSALPITEVFQRVATVELHAVHVSLGTVRALGAARALRALSLAEASVPVRALRPAQRCAA